jgi:N-acetylneuraminic acid mutarotase
LVTPNLTLPPSVPKRADPSTFSAKADAFLIWWSSIISELNSFISWANLTSQEISDSAEVAVAKANEAVSSANSAENSKIAAESARIAAYMIANANAWSAPTAYPIFSAAISPLNMQTYRRKVAGTTSIDPSLDSVNWARLDPYDATIFGLGLLKLEDAESLYAVAGVAAKYFISSAQSMPTAKYHHAIALLRDGRVLVCGGYGGVASLAESHIYSPVTNAWSAVANMPIAANGIGAATLNDGRVILVLGKSSGNYIYNPTTNLWVSIASMPPLSSALQGYSVSALKDGRVLVCGGWTGSVSVSDSYIYDPSTNTWVTVSSMPTDKQMHAAATLSDGRVFVCGGFKNGSGIRFAESHIYNPSTNIWVTVSSMPTAKFGHSAAVLSDGRVLVCGGFSNGQAFSESHIYNPKTDAWTSVSSLPSAKYGHAATALSDGRVFVCGGYGSGYVSESHIYSPSI